MGLKDIEDKKLKKQAELKLKMEEKEKSMEEVRQYFGFKIDSRDPRFQEMLAKKAEEEKARLKAKKKAEKKEKTLELLIQSAKAAASSASSESASKADDKPQDVESAKN